MHAYRSPLCQHPGCTTLVEPSPQGGPPIAPLLPRLAPRFKDVEAHLLPRQYQAHHCRQHRTTQGTTGECVAQRGWHRSATDKIVRQRRLCIIQGTPVENVPVSGCSKAPTLQTSSWLPNTTPTPWPQHHHISFTMVTHIRQVVWPLGDAVWGASALSLNTHARTHQTAAAGTCAQAHLGHSVTSLPLSRPPSPPDASLHTPWGKYG